MNAVRITLVVFLVVALTAAVGAAEIVSVTVDGSPVVFTGVPAQTIGGRVMVPLRGVLERLGASVNWDAPTRTILVQKGSSTVILPVGSRQALVNGTSVTLDVPAVVMLGTTMVPLRFVGEALGADVKWFSTTRTVQITSATTPPAGGTPPTGGTPPPADNTPAPVIDSLTHDASGWLVVGKTVTVTMKGTPGGTAFFEIPGVTGRRPMTETAAGTYTATWNVPSNAASVSGASLVGQLTVGGKNAVSQAGNQVSVDVAAPVIADIAPQSGSSVAQLRPNISATFEDGSGSGVDVGSIKMTLDGKDVTPDANVTAAFVSYKPAANLPAGARLVGLRVRDKSGNTATKQWRFTVKTASSVIKSFTFTAPANAGPGDVIMVRLEGEKGGKASFWFTTAAGAKMSERPMSVVSPGVYQAEYTIRKGEDLSGAQVVGSLTTAAGETFTMTAEKTVAGKAVALTAPVITAPRAGGVVASPLTVAGMTSPGSRVRLTVNYVGTVLGAFQVSGKITEQTVAADDNGNFRSEPVDLGTMVAASDTEYTLTAVSIGTDGKESTATTVKFTRQ